MSAYTSYVPWREKDIKEKDGDSADAKPQRPTTLDLEPQSLDRTGRNGYGGLQTFRTSGGSGVRSPLSPLGTSVRERSASAEGRTPNTFSKYSRSYSDKNELPVKSPESPKDKTPVLDKYRRYPAAYTPPETPTLRLGSSARFGGQIARSPLSERSPTVFGVGGPPVGGHLELASRATSPTPPPASSYLRARRADRQEVATSTRPRPSCRPPSQEAHAQTDPEPPPTVPVRSPGSPPPRVPYLPCPVSRYTSRVGGFGSLSRPCDLSLPLRPSDLPIRRSFPEPSSVRSPPSSVSPAPEPPSPDPSPGPGTPNDPPTRTLPRAAESDRTKTVRETPPESEKRSDVREPGGSPKLKKSGSKKKLPPQVPLKNDSAKNLLINKDFRKSTLNMDLSGSGDSGDNKSTKTKNKMVKKSSSKIKVSPSMPKLTLSSTSSSKGSGLVKTTLLDSDTTSDDSSSDSEETTSGDSTDGESAKRPPPVEKSRLLSPLTKSTSQLSSADESMTADKPPKPPLSPRAAKKLEGQKNEEQPKAVVVRCKSVAANLMKVKLPTGIPSSSTSATTTGTTTSSSTEDIPEKVKNLGSKKGLPDTSASEGSEDKPYKHNVLRKFDSGDRAFWLESNKDVPGLVKNASNKSLTSASIKKDPSVKSIPEVEPKAESKVKPKVESKVEPKVEQKVEPKGEQKVEAKGEQKVEPKGEQKVDCKQESKLDEEKGKNFVESNHTPGFNRIHTKLFKIRKMDSGERAWWMDSSPDVPSLAKERDKSDSDLSSTEPQKNDSIKSLQKTESNKSVPGLKKVASSKSLQGLQKNDSSKSLPPLQKNESTKTIPGLQKADSSKSLPPLQKNESTKSIPGLQKNQSSKSVPGLIRTPSTKSLSKGGSESSDKDGGNTSTGEYSTKEFRKPLRLCRIESGEREWWLNEEEKAAKKRAKRKDGQVFVGAFVNIDHILGTVAPPPAALHVSDEDSDDSKENCKKIDVDQVKIHDSTPKNGVISKRGMIKLDDTALQLYKDGDYGAYLDLEASIDEQQEEFESFNTNRKNSIVLRTQLSVRVHTIIEKLLNSEGRELRRALFSLKQIFQEDKDLVHEFVQNDGLACLIKVGTDADQNYQNYILRALGQIMLYVDGMNGVIEHPATVQWLYNLVACKFRLVVKTALKLLLVFVEYVESNCILFVKALRAVDYVHCTRPWSNIMKLMKEYDAADTELLIYAMSLINKTLNGLPDQDMYYDQVDALEEQGLESVIRRYMSKQGTDLDLLRQFQIYEAVLQHEDGEEKGTPLKQLDETIRKAIRNRKSLTATLNPVERRKSRRNLTGNSPLTITLTPTRHMAPEPLSPTENIMNGLPTTNGSMTNGHALHNGVENHIDAHTPVCREGTVKDLTQKLATTLHSPGEEPKLTGGPFGDMKGIISKAKEGLAKSQSRADMIKSPGEVSPRMPEVKKTETELHWEELVAKSTRDLCLCDLDFTDLASDDERDILAPTSNCNGVPPPPPPCGAPPPAPLPTNNHPPPPLNSGKNMTNNTTPPAKKTKKTVKLFWKEVREDPIVINKMNSGNLLWDELNPVQIDTQKLEHLFESRTKDLITKEKQQEMNKNKEIIVLDPKRSNAINIGMTKLPPPRSIKTAILKMDATVMNREGIEKLLTMLPSEEERSKIQEAQAANPDLPLGSAEQFLLTLASISELDARLKLWAFKLDYENSEKEIAEPLMDLKQGMENLRLNRTFKAILGTLLSIGIFLNGTEVKGFQIEYLSKVPEVKDTVHKHSLLHHLCYMVMEKFPDSTDLYSEIGAVTRASKVDFEELSGNIQKMEQECKASFDHLKLISKHDGTTSMKLKMSDFLADCAERIIVLGKVHRRVVNRFHKFCLWLGIPLHRVNTIKPNELCRIVSEFALEYRTTRERVIQQLEKKASHRERNKTRGKMITEVGKFRSQEDRADAELKQLLGNETLDKSPNNTLHGSLPWRRTRKEAVLGPVDGPNGTFTDADDEILESLVKTATKTPVSRTTPRERKRTRNADRKSLVKRSRTRENIPCGNISESA